MPRYAWYRHPRTTQERRRYHADASDVRIRGARSDRTHTLPSAYDDIARCVQRCWKEQRRIKWRRIVDMSGALPDYS